MSDTKPDVDASAIPADLQQLRQWVCWRKELRGERLQKVPYRAITGGEAKASTSDPNTWGSFKDAVAVYESSNGRYDGIGFMFSLGDPYAGVDLDGCIGPDGKVVSEAQAIIDRLGSYTEVSPSGKGVKVFIAT